MPQIDLFLSEKDLEALTNLILSQGGVLVPDKRYSTPQYSGIADVSTFMEARREAKLFFVLHRSYLVTPLEMRCKQGGDASMCYIMQRNGGPSMDIFCPAQIEAGDRRTIGQGYMGYHPTFWNEVVSIGV